MPLTVYEKAIAYGVEGSEDAPSPHTGGYQSAV